MQKKKTIKSKIKISFSKTNVQMLGEENRQDIKMNNKDFKKVNFKTIG